MPDIRRRIENQFAKLAALFFDNRYKTLIIFLVVFGILLIQIRGLRVDTSVESFFYQSDKSLLDYIEFKKQFGRDDYMVIGVKSDTVFKLDFLNRLRELHRELEEKVPHLDEIDSLINIRYTRGENDTLIVGDLLESWPETKRDIEELKQKTMGNQLYLNSIITEDGTMTAVLLKSELLSSEARKNNETISFIKIEKEDTTATNQLTEAERSEFVQTIKNISNKFERDDFQIYITGSPLLAHELRVTMVEEARLFISLVMLILLVFLYITFRRITGVVMPILIVIFATLSTFAVMSIVGMPFTLVTQILPTFIMVVGIGDTVHILALFFKHFNRTGDKREAVIYAIGHSGLAILLTSLTTAAGLLSFSTAAMAPIAHLGFTGAIGVMEAFLFTIILCPCLIAIIPLKPHRVNDSVSKDDFLDSLLRRLGRIAIQYRVVVFIIFGILLLLSIAGISKLRFAHNDLDAFSKTSEFYIDTMLLDKELKGTVVMETVLDTKEEDGLYDPEFLKTLDECQKTFEQMSFGDLNVGKTISITSIVKETNKALNNNNNSFYTIPDNRQLIAQELLLFENGGAKDIERVTDPLFSRARLTIRAPFTDAWNYVSLIDAVTDHLKQKLPEVEVKTSGLMILFAQALKKVITSMAESYIIMFVVITLLMVLLIGRLRIGLASMIPNLFPVALVLGYMGWADLPLDFFNITLGSVIVGIAVDDTIHFFHHFRYHFEKDGNAEKAVIDTFLTTGRAMITTTIVLCSGFFVLTGSDMNSLFYFGLLMGFGIFFALLGDFFLAPALLTVLNRGQIGK